MVTAVRTKEKMTEQHQLFQTQFEEGYDLWDPDYSESLHVHHPVYFPEEPLPDTRLVCR